VGSESIEAGVGNHGGGRVLHIGGGSSSHQRSRSVVNWSRSRVHGLGHDWSWGGVDWSWSGIDSLGDGSRVHGLSHDGSRSSSVEGLGDHWSRCGVQGLGSVDIVGDAGVHLADTGVRGNHVLGVGGHSAAEGAHHILLGGSHGIVVGLSHLGHHGNGGSGIGGGRSQEASTGHTHQSAEGQQDVLECHG